MVVPIAIVTMFLYGFLLGLKVGWRTFWLVSLIILVILSAFAATLNEALDPGDGSFFGTMLGTGFFLAMLGTIGILGFAAANYGAKKRNSSFSNEKGKST